LFIGHVDPFLRVYWPLLILLTNITSGNIHHDKKSIISTLYSSDEKERKIGFIINSETEIKVHLKELKSYHEIKTKKRRLAIRWSGYLFKNPQSDPFPVSFLTLVP
jgi:hypothetical protein